MSGIATRPRPQQWSDSPEAFWSLAVGVPTALLILRLWVEAGGSLQVTLLLAANVSPVSLITVAVTTASWLVSGAIVTILAANAVFQRSSDDHGRKSFFNWIATSPAWFRGCAFLLALVSWEVLYLPLLMLCAVAVYWYHPPAPTAAGTGWRARLRQALPRLLPRLGSGAAVLAVAVVLWPTIQDAWAARLWFPLTVMAVPLAGIILGATGPVAASLLPALRIATRVALVVLLVLALGPVFARPILPLNVVTTREGGDDLVPHHGNVVAVDDTTTTVLLTSGGVEYIPNSAVTGRILCPDEQDVPTYRLWIRGVHIEDSILEAVGRDRRPPAPLDPLCRAAVGPG